MAAPERQDHGPEGDVGLGGFANISTPRAPDDGRSDVALRSDAVEHGFELAGQRRQLGSVPAIDFSRTCN